MTSPTVNLLLGVHNHQPVDNWDHVCQEATELCYRPFLEVLDRFPGVKMSVHYTGYILDWLADHHPDLIKLLRQMIERGQVEIFTGGMYEPILAIIPDEDKLGQIKRLTERIKELLGVAPKGMWLAERVWEPHLVRYLAEAGVEYICLDDSHFNSVGLNDDELFGRYTSEEQGHKVDIFPVSKALRYFIPYEQPHKIMEYLRGIATPEGDRAAIYFDDGEKFGVWPGTFEWVYNQKWLENLFQQIQDNSEVVKCVLFSDYIQQHPSFGRVYLPTASYSEMLAWALPAGLINPLEDALKYQQDHIKRYLRGGMWRHFLVKYPESNNLHKKMVHVSQKVRQIRAKAADRLPEALDHLWKGQSNDAFWHGVFGGLYLTNLRAATYKHLLQAEDIADEVLHGKDFINTSVTDFDCDGLNEVLVETPVQNLYFTPKEGGGLFELDYRPKHFNLLDTLSRRYESYHDKLAQATLEGESDQTQSIHDRVVTKEMGLERLLHYDWYRRMSLLDHFLGPDTTLHNLYYVQYAEQGDFVNQPYKIIKAEDNEVILKRDGKVWVDGKHQPITVEKRIVIDRKIAQSDITYIVTNRSEDEVTLWFAPEFNVNLLAPDAHDRYYQIPGGSNVGKSAAPVASGKKGAVAVAERTELPQSLIQLDDKRLVSMGILEAIPGIELVDEWTNLVYSLTFDRLSDVWRFPVETVSQSEAGFERVYQSSAFFPNWKLTLASGQSETLMMTQLITNWR